MLLYGRVFLLGMKELDGKVSSFKFQVSSFRDTERIRSAGFRFFHPVQDQDLQIIGT